MNSSNTLFSTGRILLAVYFLLPGIMKFAQFDMHLSLMRHHGVPFAEALLAFAGLTSIIGAALLIANRHVRSVALGFVVYIALVNVLLHDFWNFQDLEAKHELQNFVKNIGILAGLLVLAGASVCRPIFPLALGKSDREI